MKNIVITFVLFISTLTIFGQNLDRYKHGTVYFEKKSNVYALIRKTINKDPVYQQEYEKYKVNYPQFKISKASLDFSSRESLYYPNDSNDNSGLNYIRELPLATQNNIVFTDITRRTTLSQKKVFGEIFLIKDSLKKIRWKITNETLNIAGFECRRANGIILDSIYIVAFYSDKIPLSAGPESFGGLPGMILGISIPHENTTWFATKVTFNPTIKVLKRPEKGKVVSNDEFRSSITTVLKMEGNDAIQLWKAYLL